MPMAQYHQRSVDAFVNAWDAAIKQIFRRLMDTKIHFDEIARAMLEDEKYFCSPVMGAKRPLPDFGGRGKGNQQARVVGGRGGYACIDTFEGRVCRFGGPPPHGTCRYNHAPDAKPSPRYNPFGDPLKLSGAVPLQAPLHALPAAVIAAAPAPAAASSAA